MPEQKKKPVIAAVISKSGNKSVKVAIDYKVKHPKYGKFVRRRTTLIVHDEHNLSAVDDIVEIAESRPYSKTKRWRLLKVLEHIVQE
jgi:small subunit ribosomal protein S17